MRRMADKAAAAPSRGIVKGSSSLAPLAARPRNVTVAGALKPSTANNRMTSSTANADQKTIGVVPRNTKPLSSRPSTTSFDIYVDENTAPADYNVVRQLQRLDEASTMAARLPLATLRQDRGQQAQHESKRVVMSIGDPEDDDDDEDDAMSAYGSAVSGDDVETEYQSAVDDLSLRPTSSCPLTPDSALVRDMYIFMRHRESSFRPSLRMMDKQGDLNESMRTVLIDWLHDVCMEFELESETLHLAVSMVDRLLSLKAVSRLHLQLVGTAALMVASKYEQIYPPELKDFVFVTDDSYTGSQILKMERKLLTSIDYDVSAPTATWFVNHLGHVTHAPKKTLLLAHYLVDLSLLDLSFLPYTPSVVAAAAFCLSNIMSGPSPWPEELQSYTGMSASSLGTPVSLLLQSFKAAPKAETRSMFEKYSHASLEEVATLPAPDSITL